MAPDPASARTQYPWLPQDGTLSLAAASGCPLSETGDPAGDDAAGKASATRVGPDSEAASVQAQASQPAGNPHAAAKLGQAWAVTAPPSASEPNTAG